MSEGGAITVAELVATVGAKIKAGEWAHVEGFLKTSAAAIQAAFHALEVPIERALDAIKETALEGDALSALSAQLGVTTDALQELHAAAVLSDSSAESLNQGLTFLARSAAAAADGSAEAMQSLEGIQLRDAAGQLRPVDELFGDLAEKVAATDSPTKRLAMTLKVLGRGSRDLVPLLSGGRQAIERLREEARLSGEVISAAQIKAGEAYDDAIKHTEASLKGLRNAFASVESIEALTAIQEALADLARTDTVRRGFVLLGRAVTAVLQGVARLVTAFVAWADAHPDLLVDLLVAGALALSAALGYLAVTTIPGLVMALLPLLPTMLAVSAAFVALLLVADDIRAFGEGADSVIGRVIAWLNTPVDAKKDGLLGTLKELWVAGKELWGLLQTVDWAPVLEGAFKLIKFQVDALRTSLDLLIAAVRLLQGMGVNFTEAGRAGVDAIGRAVTPGGNLIGAALEARRLYQTINAPVTSTVNVTVGEGTAPGPVAAAVEEKLNQWWDGKLRDEFVSITQGAQ